MITSKDSRNGSNKLLKENLIKRHKKGYTKEDNNGKDYLIEDTVKRIADYLFIHCCEVVQNSNEEFVSIVAETRYDIKTFEELEIPNNLKDCNDIFNSEQMLDLYQLVFLDCIIGNIDRHSENVAVYYESSNNIIKGIYPSFDTALSITNSTGNNCLFGVDDKKSYNHFETIKYLYEENLISKIFEAYFNLDFDSLDIKVEEHIEWLKNRRNDIKRYLSIYSEPNHLTSEF